MVSDAGDLPITFPYAQASGQAPSKTTRLRVGLVWPETGAQKKGTLAGAIFVNFNFATTDLKPVVGTVYSRGRIAPVKPV